MTSAIRLGLLLAVAPLLLSGCALVSDGAPSTGDVRVTQAVMSAGINEQGQATAPGRVFFTTAQRIYAVINLEGVKPGIEISGKWYQTGVENVPAEGSEVHSSTIKLDDQTATADGHSRVALFLPATTQGIPEDAWVLRVYAGNDLIRTMAFVVVAQSSGTTAPPAQTNPAPTSVPNAPAAATATPRPQTYTVVAGDTLNSIALRFKPATEDVAAFTGRLRTANNLTSDNLSVGQVLRIP